MIKLLEGDIPALRAYQLGNIMIVDRDFRVDLNNRGFIVQVILGASMGVEVVFRFVLVHNVS